MFWILAGVTIVFIPLFLIIVQKVGEFGSSIAYATIVNIFAFSQNI